MPDLLHKPTLRVRQSAKLQVWESDPSNYVQLTRQQFLAASAIPLHYRKLNGAQDDVVEMSGAEKAAVDVTRSNQSNLEGLLDAEGRLGHLNATKARLQGAGKALGPIQARINALTTKLNAFVAGLPAA